MVLNDVLILKTHRAPMSGIHLIRYLTKQTREHAPPINPSESVVCTVFVFVVSLANKSIIEHCLV